MLPVLQRGPCLNAPCRPDFAHLTDGQAYVDLLHPERMAVVDTWGNESLLLVPGGLEAVHVSVFAPMEMVEQDGSAKWLICKGADLAAPPEDAINGEK
eukprot:s270_g11.t1